MIETSLLDYLSPLMKGVNLALDEAANSSPPLIEFTVLDAPRNKTTKLTSAHLRTELEIECWHTTSVNAKKLCDQLTQHLQDFSGQMGSYHIYSINIYNEHSGYSKDKLYYRNLTINISYKKG